MYEECYSSVCEQGIKWARSVHGVIPFSEVKAVWVGTLTYWSAWVRYRHCAQFICDLLSTGYDVGQCYVWGVSRPWDPSQHNSFPTCLPLCFRQRVIPCQFTQPLHPTSQNSFIFGFYYPFSGIRHCEFVLLNSYLFGNDSHLKYVGFCPKSWSKNNQKYC